MIQTNHKRKKFWAEKKGRTNKREYPVYFIKTPLSLHFYFLSIEIIEHYTGFRISVTLSVRTVNPKAGYLTGHILH